MQKHLLYIVCLITFFSCDLKNDQISKEEAQAVKQELNNRKIRKISEADIVLEAQTKGREIVKRSSDSLKFHLMSAIQKNGVNGAISYCNTKATDLTNQLSKQMYAEIRRVSLLNRNPDNAPKSEIEKQILEAYQYNFDNKIEMSENLQVEDTFVLYTKPIMVEAKCLYCHGEVDRDIAPENVIYMKQLYPEGKAIGYKIGDFRGMWSVKFNKKELIKHMK